MKKVFLRILAILIVLTMTVSLMVACVDDKGDEPEIPVDDIPPQELELPEFSIDIFDGSAIIIVTNDDLRHTEMTVISTERKGNITYYKGFDFMDILSLKNIDVSGIQKVEFVDDEDPADPFKRDIESTDLKALEVILAVFFAETEDGEYEEIGSGKGPVRAVGKIDVQKLNRINIIR